MKKLLQYLGNYKKESILGPLFKLLEASIPGWQMPIVHIL